MEAFLYCWTDHRDNMLYVGSRKGHPGDGYVCSSKYMLEQYKSRPHDFTRQIIAHGDLIDIRKLETTILETVGASRSKDFYNQHNNNGKFILKFHTEAAKKAISVGNKGKRRPDVSTKNRLGHTAEIRKKISDNHHDVSGKNNPMFGKKHTPESIEKMKTNRKGKGTALKTKETKLKMSEARKKYWAKKKELLSGR